MGFSKHFWIKLAMLFMVNLIGVQAKNRAFPELSEDEFDELSSGIVPIYRYENPINRDHFVWWGQHTNINFSDFNFDDYRFDGFITNVMSKQVYDKVLAKKSWAPEMMLPVFHGYHTDMKHNYFSKPWEPYFEGPVFYCARKKGFAKSKLTLWTLDGQPIDENGNLGYDTIYTTTLIERDLPNVEDYVMYRILCYTWDEITAVSLPIKASPNRNQLTPYIHGHWNKLIPLYQFYNEHDQDHYYQTKYTQSAQEYANFKNTVAYILDSEKAKTLKECKIGKDLVPLIQAYDEDKSNHVIFVSQERMDKIVKEDKLVLTKKEVLGYVARNQDSGCRARYKLNIRIRGAEGEYNEVWDQQGNDERDQDVYIAPDAFKTADKLYHDQVFYIW